MGFTETRALDIYYGADRKPRNANGDLIGFIGEDVKGSHLASEIRFHFPESADLAETYSITIVAKRADGQLRFDVCERVVDAEIGTYYKAELNNWYNEKHGTLTLSVKVYKGEVTITEGVITPSAGTSIIVGTTFTFDVKYAPTPTTQVAADELSTLELILLAVETRPVFDDIIRVVYVMPDLTELDENDNPRYDTRMFLLVNEENTTLYYIDGSTAVEANIGTTIAKLLDTDIDSLVSGDVLSWNGTKWENSTRLSTAEVTIASNTSRIGTNEGNINALDVRVGANEDDIEDIKDGTTIVGKAYADEDGINIKENYVRIGDNPNTPILDENNKLPNSYLQDDVPLLDENDKLDNAWLKDDVPLINTKTDRGIVFWNATLGKLDTNTNIKFYHPYNELYVPSIISSSITKDYNTISLSEESGIIIKRSSTSSGDNTNALTILKDGVATPIDAYGYIVEMKSKTGGTITTKFKMDVNGNFEANGNISLGGDLNIAGDIIQQGSAYETHAEHIYTTKDHIILRDGAVGGLAVGAYAGLFAKLADGTNDSALVFDGNGMARVGDITYSGSTPNYSNTQALATRQDTPTSNAIAYWNASAYRFDTSSGLVLDLGDNANAGLTINKSAGAGNIANFQYAGANKLEITKDGFITQNGTRFIHNYTHAAVGGVQSQGQNTYVGLEAGNLATNKAITQTYHDSGNVGLGYYALRSNTLGYFNTAIGKNALTTNLTGNENVAIGLQAMNNNTSGSSNIAIGLNAMENNTSGGQNVAVGHSAIRLNLTGTYNIALGYQSGRYIADGTTGRTTGNYGVYIGSGTRASADGTSNEIVIGYNAIGQGSNSVVLGNTDITKTILRGNVGINQTSPTSQLHIVSSATDKVGLIVDMPTSATANIQEWKINGTNRAYIRGSDGQFVFGNPINVATIQAYSGTGNGIISLASTGTTITRNVADTNTALIVNQANASSTGNILDLQFNGTSKTQIESNGRIRVSLGVSNYTSTNNSYLILGDTGSTIYRNISDANNTYAALKINNQQGNGDIVKFQFNGTTLASINKSGVLVDNDGSAGTDGQVLQKVSGEMLWANVEDATARMISTTYADLVSSRTAGTLIAGTFYRITDYTCTTTQSNTQSGGNVFDIIVIATDDDTLSEDARAILHSGDTYFASSNLNAWELKYSLTNDTSRFYWADTSTGKGVIYFMKDEFQNECGYDFKNIKYLVGETYVYTFSDASLTGDDSLDGSFRNNKISSYYYSGTYRLGKNIFKGGCLNNRFINNCHDNTFGINCDSNTLDNCYSVEFGIHCDNNNFEDAHTYLFGDYCSNNSVIGSNTCSFGDYYYGMTINRYVSNVQGSVDGTISSIFMYITIESPMIGTSAESKLDICFTGLPNRSYPTTFTRDANGKYIAKWHSALLTLAGKYKDDATDTTWEDIS